MDPRALRIAVLLVGSGLCALIYQTIWLRELRLVFGASTAASAAVLAIFMGGLGLGSHYFGRRADAHRSPLALYSSLEILVAISALLTLPLLSLAERSYILLGGTLRLGQVGGTLVRLLLSTLTLLLPAFFMGGTLPAAIRAAQTREDGARRRLALLYSANTLGAVLGALLTTFFLLEAVGNSTTLTMACLVNALIGMVARRLARQLPPPERAEAEPLQTAQGRPPTALVLGAAALVGFTYLLMELTWYRMLSPILGGSTFTFGLILAVALLGIGLGGVIYALFGKAPTLRGFAVSCGLEAFFLILPFALGDRVALLALFLDPLATLGFFAQVLAWGVVTLLVVLPASIVSGYQFPLLLGLLGRGERDVGRHVGQCYAFNTAGAILGSLCGGFGFMPLLSAPGTWRLSAGLLLLLSAMTQMLARTRPLLPATLVGVTLVLLHAEGPTAAWRHSGIGARRATLPGSALEVQSFLQNQRQDVLWERDGIESSIALGHSTGTVFVVNGKVDGSALGDAGTQVMGGLLGVLLHPGTRRAMVVGLGTGSTAGWLAQVPSVEQVDVAELEPAVIEVARACAAVNHGVLDQPKVHVLIGDAREILLTSRRRYDLIFSEPSNPYRAGIANLFTQDFYRAVEGRLSEGGVFLQWVQGYEIDGATLSGIYATLASVFPEVETWQSRRGDLILLASRQRVRYEASVLRARLASEPFRSAMLVAWRAEGLEGFLAHHVAHPGLAKALLLMEEESISTDDHPLVEFGFAHSMGRRLFSAKDLWELSRFLKVDRPVVQGEVDWVRVEDYRMAANAIEGVEPVALPTHDAAQTERLRALSAYVDGDHARAVRHWRKQPKEPEGRYEWIVLSDSLAALGDEAALPIIERLRVVQPADAELVSARLYFVQRKWQLAATALESAFRRSQEDPWTNRDLLHYGVELAGALAEPLPEAGAVLFSVLARPFAAYSVDRKRLVARFDMSKHLKERTSACLHALRALEPHVPWEEAFLQARVACYQAARHPLLARARSELRAYEQTEPALFGNKLRP